MFAEGRCRRGRVRTEENIVFFADALEDMRMFAECCVCVAKCAGGGVVTGENQGLDGCNEHVARFGAHISVAVVEGDGVVDGVVHVLFDGTVDNSVIDETADVAVEGAAVLPFLIVATGADIV